MPPGRAPDACWKYFKPNTGADKDKKPYVDIFHGKTQQPTRTATTATPPRTATRTMTAT